MFNRIKLKMRTLLGSANVKNASWIIAGKLAQMLISMVVGLLTARYLGPDRYGTINYANSYIAFFTAICTLGINSILVKEILEKPNEQGEIIGTTLVLRFFSSVLSIVTIFAIVSVVDKDEPTTILVVLLCSLRLFFEIFDTFDYWFQARLQSKVPAVAKTMAILVVSLYKVLILILKKNILWFAIATSIDYVVYAIVLIFAYRKNDGQSLVYSGKRALQLLMRSYHFMLSGIAIAIYGYIDRLMIKQLLKNQDVGLYSAATNVSMMWTFILLAIIDSMRPTIMLLYEKNREQFYRRLTQLYSIIIYLSAFVSFFFFIFGYQIIDLLYGEKFISAASTLRIVTWSTAFAYLGVARNIWIICENKQKYLLKLYVLSAIVNIFFNYYLIPRCGIEGAAWTAVITQVSSSVVIPLFYKDLRANTIFIFKAFLLPTKIFK